MTWNPFNWTAEPFLALYVSIAVIVFLLGFGFRSMIGQAAHATRRLSVLELAFLGGGARRLGDAALLCLTSGNGATIATKDHAITVTDQTPLATLMGRPTRLPVPAWHDTTAVSDGDQATRRAGAGAPARVGILPDRRSDDVLPNDRAALCRAAPGVWDHQGDRGHRTAPSGRDSRSSFSSSQHSPASCWRCVRRGRGPARTF